MSNVAKHSPLPWEATVENGGRAIIIRPKGQGWLLATVPLDTFTAQRYSGHDTAALIVRAVNSLDSSIAAMEAALEHVGQTVPMSDNGRREREEMMARLRAAITLARGEQ